MRNANATASDNPGNPGRIWPSRWEEECALPGAPAERARQGFFPDGSRSFEEIDRLSVGPDGLASSIGSLAEVDFYRLLPPSGYTKGLPAHLRTDVGEGDIAPEVCGKNFFPYKPRNLSARPPRPPLARLTNITHWLEGDPCEPLTSGHLRVT